MPGEAPISRRRNSVSSVRLKTISQEIKRLVEGYRKGLYTDFMMQEDMELIEKEQRETETRKVELERQLSRRLMTTKHKAATRKMMDKLSTGLSNLDFNGRQQLLRLLIENKVYDGQNIGIKTIIPSGE
jgi:hypothetical protein